MGGGGGRKNAPPPSTPWKIQTTSTARINAAQRTEDLRAGKQTIYNKPREDRASGRIYSDYGWEPIQAFDTNWNGRCRIFKNVAYLSLGHRDGALGSLQV